MKKIWEKTLKFLRDPASQTIIAIVTLLATIAWGTIQGWFNGFAYWLLKNSSLPNWMILVIFMPTILLGLYLVKNNFRKPQKTIPTETQKKQPLTNIDTYSTSPRPKEIIDQIDSVPPFQKNNIQKSYEGIKVKWRLKFLDIVDTDNKIAWLQLSGYDDFNSANIYIHADMEKYPRIKTLKRGESLFVIAEIKEITDYNTIWLTNAIIKFSVEE